LKAGGAYVPLDATYPRERLAFMLNDTRTPLLLTQQKLLSRIPQQDAKVICLDADWELMARESRQNLTNATGPENLAYIMYTSGSTGLPKGVAVPHRAVNRLVVNTNYIKLDSTDRIAQVSNISFDAATFEIWGALLNGGRLVGFARDVALSPQDFANELKEQGITAMFLTVALFNQLAAEVPGIFQPLRTTMAGGEALDPKWVRAVLKDRPPQRLVNGYGPTENTTFTCCYEIRGLEPGQTNVPIGKPISNTRVYILDRYLNPVPAGVAGELFTGGDGLARGYWNRPELTAEKFVPDPFGEAGSSGFLYRTGDLARYLPDGSIEFLGRIDQQVKIRGFRIELGEIETILGQHPGVRECAVTVRGENSGVKKLVAYIVPAAGHNPNASELRSFLGTKLPDYMVPSAFITLPAMPLTPNGKVDRKALPAPDQNRPELEKKYVAPRDGVERQLTEIWEKVLGVKPIGIEDKFFDLGGHSLLAVRVIAQIEKAFGRKLRLATIFQAPTIEQLAAIIREETKENNVTRGTSVVEIQGQGGRSPLFLVHGAGGGMFWGYVNLSKHLGNEQPVYGFKSRGLDGREELRTIEELAAQYVMDLRNIQPKGPYYLGGYCFGGNVAYDMARQLTGQGEKVALLALLNCAPPNSRYTRIPWTPKWGLRLLKNLWYWADYFCQWSATQRQEFFRWKWNVWKHRLARLGIAARGQPGGMQAGELVDLSSYTEEQRKVWETHIQALIQFHPQPFPGRVHLFRSPGHPLWCAFEPDFGWADFAKGGVDITIVSGAHEKILEEPFVSELAAKLAKTMGNNLLEEGRAEIDDGRTRPAPIIPENREQSARQEVVDGAELLDRPGTDSTYPVEFARQIKNFGSGQAVRFEGESLTYAELDARSNQLAHRLEQLGVGPEVLVGICLERSLGSMIALLAVLKAGGAYLPLDPDYPAERLSYMMEDSRAQLLLTTQRLAANVSHGSAKLVCLDEPAEKAAIRAAPASQPETKAGPHNLAYVIYTSGSTGTPKGVEITHRALLSHNFAVINAYQIRAEDRVLQFTPFSFDISVEEIFPSWLCGCAVVLRAHETISSLRWFLDFLRRERITILNLPTSYWHELVEFLHSGSASLPETVRLVVIGGEKASDEAFQRWKQRVGPGITLVNGYGATEATVTSTIHVAGPDDSTLPIGKPLENTKLLLLDEQLHEVGPGEPGEICIGGVGLARGYLNRRELTAAKFVFLPGPNRTSERYYRTGDLGRVRSDGCLEFIGRVDEQVKIRGFRIELGEVEEVIRQHPRVKEAAVVAREESGKKRLVGYFVPRSDMPVRSGELMGFLKKKLPAYMVPSALVPLATLPLTPAGKVDRNALPGPGSTRPELEQAFVGPRNPSEQALAQIWSEVLGVRPVGVHDNFFDLGGESLLAIQAISRIREHFKIEISLAAFFAKPTLAELAAWLDEASRSSKNNDLMPAARNIESLPLSERQRRIWFLEEFDATQSLHNLAVRLELKGELNTGALREALTMLLTRHAALRAIFPAEAGQPVQKILPAGEADLQMIDLRQTPREQRIEQAQKVASEEARKSHIAAGQLLRTVLLRLDDTEHWLLLIVHEIAADTRSVQILIEELGALYDSLASGRAPGLPRLTGQYPEVGNGATGLSADEQKKQLDYWLALLTDAPTVLNLPTDKPRPARRTNSGARKYFNLPAELVQRLKQFTEPNGASLSDVLLAAYAGVLHRYTASTDIVIGSSVSYRTGTESEHLIGNFENIVPLRIDLSGEPAFTELARRVNSRTTQAAANGGVAFSSVLDRLQPERSTSHSPVFQVSFSLNSEPPCAQRWAGVTATPFAVDKQTARLDLELNFEAAGDAIAGWIDFSTDIFEPNRIERFISHFQTLLSGAMARHEARICDLPLLTPSELHQVLNEWNATERPFPSEKTLAQLFFEQAARTPNAEAVVSGDERLTYQDLAHRAALVSDHLLALGVPKGALVAVCVNRTWELLAALLGTLHAGCAYVPLDASYPKERLAFILEDSKASALVTKRNLAQTLPHANAAVLCLEELDWHASPSKSNQETAPNSAADDLAYVIYTSGSTGRPKGVAIENRSAVAFVCWARNVFTDDELSGVLASTSACFDVSIFEMFVPLCWGGRVIMAENPLVLPTLPAANEVKLIATVPSAMRELLRMRAVPASLRVVNFAGEPLPASLADQVYAETAVKKVYDLYGPTETATYSTYTLRRPSEPANIGRPLDNEQIYVLDGHFQPVPIGVPGDLYIGGVGLARYYLNRPELTAEKFVPHPFEEGARLFRTGDLARWREDGRLEYLGRSDFQVKIRGFRIELGEIEAALKGHAGVRDVLVTAQEDRLGEKSLVAYVVPKAEQSAPVDELRQVVKAKLPDYMLPGAFVILKEFPLTPNGKINRKALPAPDSGQRSSTTEFVAPRNPVEQRLAAIWEEVLQHKKLGVHDNFFELGGHSLQAIRVVSRVREIFKVDLPLFSLFDTPTIATLAEGLAGGRWSQSSLVPLPAAGANRTQNVPVSFVQERLWFLDQLQPDDHAYNVPAALRLSGPLNAQALERALAKMVAQHEALRTCFKSDNGNLIQVIRPSLELKLAVHDLQSIPLDDRESRGQTWANAEAQRPFDLAEGPLIRASLAQLGEADYVLLIVMHHSISDGWSLALFFQQLAALYDAFSNGSDATPNPQSPGFQYADYAIWQRQWLTGPVLEREQEYWKEKLTGAPPAVDLPTDRPEPEISTGKAQVRRLSVSPALSRQMAELCRGKGCTPFMVFLSALAVTLSRWTGQMDLVLGTVVAGRNRREFEDVLGCFMNFLPVRVQLSTAKNSAEVLAQVRSTVLDGQAHQECPFEKIVEAINPQRKLNQNPLYNVGLLLQNFPAQLFPSRQIKASTFPISLEAALLDLRFEVEPSEAGFSVNCEYRTDLFEPQTIQHLLDSYSKALDLLIRQPTAVLADYVVDSELTAQARAARARKERQTIAIAATFTAEPLLEPLRYWFQKLELSADVAFAPYNQVFQQLLDPNALFASNQRGMNVLLVRLEDWQAGASGGNQNDVGAWMHNIERNVKEFVAALRTASSGSPVPHLVCICPCSATLAASPPHSAFLQQMEDALGAELDGLADVHVLTPRHLARWYPVKDYYDPSGEELGHVPFKPAYFTALGTAIVRKFHALGRPAPKVLVLDCDQTLWTGVCGEDGAQGICLDEPRLALQRFAREQHDAGMLICICSKNQEEDVREVFSTRSEMPLRAEQITSWRVNWRSKSENLKSLAEELNLGLDSFVFVDDNPVECAEVEANCPEVLVMQLPEDTSVIPKFLEHCWIFDRLKVTSEDRRRAHLYRENQQREQFRTQAPSLEGFLVGLQIKLQIEPLTPERLARASQLTQRTNQFNCHPKHMSESELRHALLDHEAMTVTVSDRFGDYGLVGVMLYKHKAAALDVEAFLLSCRVLGRGVEHQMLVRLGQLAQEKGCAWLDLHFTGTPRNKPALDFLESVGFQFRQAQNGGYIFRFPAEYAAKLRFKPSESQKNTPAAAQSAPAASGNGGHRSARKFSQCRALALEANDVEQIHSRIEAKPKKQAARRDGYVPPLTDIEQKLCVMWQDLLRLDQVGRKDNFFDLGGHSLLAVRLFAEIERVTGNKFPLVTLFQAPTIEQLARVVSAGDSSSKRSLLVPVQPQGDKPPLFLVHGAGGDVLWGYANLAAHLPKDQPIYGIKSRGQIGLEELDRIESLAACYLESVRAFQPRGPYYLGGYCFGGNVAYEMARQLRAQGEEVGLVALLDSAPSNAGYERMRWWRPAFIPRFLRNSYDWLKDFSALKPEERSKFFSRKSRALGRKALRLLRGSKQPVEVDLEEVIEPSQFPESELKLWRIHLQALTDHIERPYTGEVTLLRTRGQPLFCSLEEDFCWKKLARGGVVVKRIPGSHENIFMEPNVRSLAAELASALKRAQENHAQKAHTT
jgi:amino acid adenylation domain-containing protein/FkbH-like protein